MPTFAQHWWVGWFLSGCFENPTVAKGVYWGSVLPDVDVYLAFLFILLGREPEAMKIHRGPTHSLLCFALLAVCALTGIAPLFLMGFLFGMGVHVVLDFFFWLWFVDLFWPLRYWVSWAKPINLWDHVSRKTIETWGYYLELVDHMLVAAFLTYQKERHPDTIVCQYGPTTMLALIPALMIAHRHMSVRYFFALTHGIFMVLQMPLFVWVSVQWV